MEGQHQWIEEDTAPVIVASSIGLIVSINSTFEKTYLWSPKDLVGQPLSTIIPENLKDAHNMGFSRYRINQKSNVLNSPLDLEVLRGDGGVQTARHYIVSFEQNGEQMFAARIDPL